MKLAVKISGLCASGVFLITTFPAFFQQIAPVGLSAVPLGVVQGMNIIETIIFGLIGSLMAGAIGYLIGDILANPQGKPEARPSSSVGKNETALSEPGNETFLGDLEPISAVPLADEPEPAIAQEAPPENMQESEAESA